MDVQKPVDGTNQERKLFRTNFIGIFIGKFGEQKLQNELGVKGIEVINYEHPNKELEAHKQ